MPRDTVDQFLVAASEILDCSEVSEGDGSFGGAALMHGETACHGEIFSKETVRFSDALAPLLEGSARTYEPPDESG